MRESTIPANSFTMHKRFGKIDAVLNLVLLLVIFNSSISLTVYFSLSQPNQRNNGNNSKTTRKKWVMVQETLTFFSHKGKQNDPFRWCSKYH